MKEGRSSLVCCSRQLLALGASMRCIVTVAFASVSLLFALFVRISHVFDSFLLVGLVACLFLHSPVLKHGPRSPPMVRV